MTTSAPTAARAWPDVAIPPGELLAETIEALGLSQAEFARRAGRPIQAINEIVRGKKEITAETAIEFERVLGTPAHIWVRLEADYRIVKARLAAKEQLRQHAPEARAFPYAAMARCGWVPKTLHPVARLDALLEFFGVASLSQVDLATAAAWRRSTKVKNSPEALAAWLRQGEREATAIDTGPFSAADVTGILPAIRAMTLAPAETIATGLRDLLAPHGVAAVFIPELPKTGAHGATRWLGGKAVVQVSLRYRFADIFWFSFFHELGHVLKHGRRSIFIAGTDSDSEREADRFAAEQLIPESQYRSLRDVRVTAEVIRRFAASIGIHPGIVVGRLQHDGRLTHAELNSLRTRYVWSDPCEDADATSA